MYSLCVRPSRIVPFYFLFLPSAFRPHLVEVTQLPEEDEQLLVELDLLGGVGEVGLRQGVGEQPRQALQDEVVVLGRAQGTAGRQNGAANAFLKRSAPHALP